MTDTISSCAKTLTGSIYAGGQWIDGKIEWESGRISRLSGVQIDEAQAQPPYILPGFIDLHVHGGGGRDVMESGDAIATIARTHARYGTTTLLATTMTASHEDILKALDAVADYRRQQAQPSADRDQPSAEVIGVHLEGPYLNPDKLGAQPNFTRVATPEELAQYQQRVPLKVITLAPELLEENGALEWLLAHQVRIQSGHTLADYATAEKAYRAGIRGFTHLYNAMPALKHRDPGLLGFALAHAEYAEIIPDLVHTHPGALQAALRAIPSLYAVTDGTAACGMPDGAYRLGVQAVFKQGGCVRLANGGLAGSCLTLDQALRNLISVGRTLSDASERLAAIPARYLGLTDRGILSEGYRADVVVFDAAFALEHTFCGGREVTGEAV